MIFFLPSTNFCRHTTRSQTFTSGSRLLRKSNSSESFSRCICGVKSNMAALSPEISLEKVTTFITGHFLGKKVTKRVWKVVKASNKVTKLATQTEKLPEEVDELPNIHQVTGGEPLVVVTYCTGKFSHPHILHPDGIQICGKCCLLCKRHKVMFTVWTSNTKYLWLVDVSWLWFVV